MEENLKTTDELLEDVVNANLQDLLINQFDDEKQKKEKPIGFSLLSVCLPDVSHKKGRRIGSFASHFNQVVTFYQNRAKPC